MRGRGASRGRAVSPRSSLVGRLLVALATGVVGTLVALPQATAAPPGDVGLEPPSTSPPPVTQQTQRRTVTPLSVPTSTCSVYASSSGFGMLCSNGLAGQTLAFRLKQAGINSDRFCWDDSELPDGFDPAGQGAQPEGPGRWWLHTCLTFEGAVVKSNARLSYEYVFRRPGTERLLTRQERDVVDSVVGRGQIPYLQVQTFPLSSPRVEQDVAFSMLCSAKVTCVDTAQGRRIETPRVDVGGVVMHAALVHLQVLPEGRQGPTVDCTGGGLARTAEQLDGQAADDPRVCRYAYDRSSDAAGAGTRGDRFPAQVTAYWQVFVDDGNGPVPFRDAYEKTSTNLIRVTEVQTLVVS